jgi:hypothetical protein
MGGATTSILAYPWNRKPSLGNIPPKRTGLGIFPWKSGIRSHAERMAFDANTLMNNKMRQFLWFVFSREAVPYSSSESGLGPV